MGKEVKKIVIRESEFVINFLLFGKKCF